MKIFVTVIFIAFVSLSLHAVGATDVPTPTKRFVENSYIVTFKPATQSEPAVIIPPEKDQALRAKNPPKFGEHGTGQSKEALATALGLRGDVLSIFETINAAHLAMTAAEAERLRKDARIERVEQDLVATAAQTVQNNPGWALDRLDQQTTALNNQYVFNSNGAGQTIYILDSGLDLNNPLVVAEFGTRATVFWDVNGAGGVDCFEHGTQVASAAAGTTHGIAKGATVIVAKITTGCSGLTTAATMITAFNWLTANTPRGTIANLSYAFGLRGGCGGTSIIQAVDTAIQAAFNAGVIVVISAGNDSCNTANYSLTRIPEAFVVGATDASRLNLGLDARATFSRIGANISVFAPGTAVLLLNFNGTPITANGTSFSAPYMAGMFAVGCQAAGTLCATATNAGVAYTALRNIGLLNTVVDSNGQPLPAPSTPRFISRQPW